MSIKRLRQRGDTIVEVLVCMAIVSGSLATSYGIARKSLVRVREAEERGQSLRLAEQQIERFKQYLKTNPNVTTAPPSPPGPPLPAGKTSLVSSSPINTAGFCIYNDGTKYNIPAGLGPEDGPKNPRCAVNTAGQFYCDHNPPSRPRPGACGGVLTFAAVNAAGYNSTAAIIYPVLVGTERTLDQFYAAAGRYTAGGENANSKAFDVVVIPYRTKQ